MAIVPDVGSVIRLSARSNVLFPAPFRPTMPTTDPLAIENEMSSSARNGRRLGTRSATDQTAGAPKWRGHRGHRGLPQCRVAARPRAEDVLLGQVVDDDDR